MRQLLNLLEQAVALATTNVIPASLVQSALREDASALVPFEEARKTFERDYLVRLLKITGGNVTQAALLAKRNRTEFYKLLQRHRLEPAMFKEGKAPEAAARAASSRVNRNRIVASAATTIPIRNHALNAVAIRIASANCDSRSAVLVTRCRLQCNVPHELRSCEAKTVRNALHFGVEADCCWHVHCLACTRVRLRATQRIMNSFSPEFAQLWLADRSAVDRSDGRRAARRRDADTVAAGSAGRARRARVRRAQRVLIGRNVNDERDCLVGLRRPAAGIVTVPDDRIPLAR